MALQQQAEEIARLNERVRDLETKLERAEHARDDAEDECRELETKLEKAQDARDDAEEDRRDAVADCNASLRDKAHYRAALNTERRLLIRLEEAAENVVAEANKAEEKKEFSPALHDALVQLSRQMMASKYRE